MRSFIERAERAGRARSVCAFSTVALLLSQLFACSSMHIRTDADPSVVFARYHTYSWIAHPVDSAARPQAAALDQTIKEIANKELAAKNLRPAGNQEPDLLVSYFGVSRTSVSYGPGPSASYWGHHGYSDPYFDKPYVSRLGTLTLQFIDTQTRRVVWEGTAEDVIGDQGASQEQVARAVNQIIEKYPTA